MMDLPTQLARWTHKTLSAKFTFASMAGNPFEIRYSTIKRDSNLLNCGQERDKRCDVGNAFARLVESQVLRKQVVTGGRGKVVEVIYQNLPDAGIHQGHEGCEQAAQPLTAIFGRASHMPNPLGRRDGLLINLCITC